MLIIYFPAPPMYLQCDARHHDVRGSDSTLSNCGEHMSHRISHGDMVCCNYKVLLHVDMAGHVDMGPGMLTWSAC